MEKVANEKGSSTIRSIFENEIKRIQDEINNYDKKKVNHIAVISEPYSGIDYILNKITGDNSEKINDIKLFGPVKNKDYFTNFYTNKEIVLLRNSQYLYTRKKGGFNVYEAFLNNLPSADRLFITSWNKFAWNYIKEISNIEDLFPVQIHLPELDSKSLMKIIMSGLSEKIVFIDDRDFTASQNLWVRGNFRINISFLNINCNIPYFKPNFKALKAEKRLVDMQDVQSEVFFRITRLAEGKYDVAYKIWKNSLKDNEIRMSRIPQLPLTTIPNLNESFVLSIILSMEAICYDDLQEVTGPVINLRQVTYRLVSAGLIENSNDNYRINPEAVNYIINHLRKIRMVW